MPAGLPDSQYYIQAFEKALPSDAGEPLTTGGIRDLTIVNDANYFGDIVQRVRLANTPNVNEPPLPGFEPEPISAEDLVRKERNAVAAARVAKSRWALSGVMIATFDADTDRSLWRLSKKGIFIPVDIKDTENSLYLRVGDDVDRLFEAAAIRRIVPSAYTRERGEKDLRSGFEQREKWAVLPLATYAARNNLRLLKLWINQLETTSEGMRFVPRDAKEEFSRYLLTRPNEYLDRPDLASLLAERNRKNTGRYARSA